MKSIICIRVVRIWIVSIVRQETRSSQSFKGSKKQYNPIVWFFERLTKSEFHKIIYPIVIVGCFGIFSSSPCCGWTLCWSYFCTLCCSRSRNLSLNFFIWIIVNKMTTTILKQKIDSLRRRLMIYLTPILSSCKRKITKKNWYKIVRWSNKSHFFAVNVNEFA